MPTNALGPLLRHWRAVRGRSQFDLSLDTGISQRHLSFVESGRSVPGRQTLLDIARALDVPLRDRNAFFLAAGYAPIYSEAAWNTAEMASITRALQRTLRQHEPFPAVVLDRHWNVLLTNDAAPRFFDYFNPAAVHTPPRNMLHLLFDPARLRPFVADWEKVAPSLFERVHRESIGRVVDDKTRELLAALLAYPGVKPTWQTPASTSSASALPMIPLGFVKDGLTLNYFSLVTTVGTPQTVAAQELRLECMFPADEATERHHLDLFGDSPPALP